MTKATPKHKSGRSCRGIPGIGVLSARTQDGRCLVTVNDFPASEAEPRIRLSTAGLWFLDLPLPEVVRLHSILSDYLSEHK